MRPIVGNFCAALTASMVALTEINAFNLPLWYIWDAIRQPWGVPGPICRSMLSSSLASYPGSLWRALAKPRKEQGGPCSFKSAPSPYVVIAEKMERVEVPGEISTKVPRFPSSQVLHTVFSHSILISRAVTPIQGNISHMWAEWRGLT